MVITKALHRNFVNEPTPLKLQDYTEVFNECVDKFSRLSAVQAVYQIGNVGKPGITDLDFYIVVDPERIKGETEKLQLKNFSKKAQYILWFDTVILNKELLMNFFKLMPIFDIKKVFAKEDVNVKPLPQEEKFYFNHLFLNDITVLALANEYQQLLDSEIIDIRWALTRIKKFKYATALFKELSGVEKKEWTSFNRDLDIFINQWFDLDATQRNNQLIDFIKRSVDVSKTLTIMMHESNLKNEIFKYSSCNEKCKYIGNRVPIVFGEETVSYHEKKLFMPITFFMHLKEYARNRGVISEYMRSNLIGRCDYSIHPSYRQCASERISLVNLHQNLLREIDYFKDTMFNFGYGRYQMRQHIRRYFHKMIRG